MVDLIKYLIRASLWTMYYIITVDILVIGYVIYIWLLFSWSLKIEKMTSLFTSIELFSLHCSRYFQNPGVMNNLAGLNWIKSGINIWVSGYEHSDFEKRSFVWKLSYIHTGRKN